MEKEEDMDMDVASEASEELKVYKVAAYLNSNKDPFGLTIKGKTKGYIKAHKKIQGLAVRGKNVNSKEGKLKFLDVSRGRGMVNGIVEVSVDCLEKGEVEIKVYDPSLDKKKGATIELRKVSDFDYIYVEKVKDIITSLIDNFLKEGEKNVNVEVRKPGTKENLTCDICDWETRHSSALKGHMKRMHSNTQIIKAINKCEKCDYKTQSIASMMVHKRIEHEKESKKRQKDTFQCRIEKCASTFDTKQKLETHKSTQHESSRHLQENKSPTSSPPRKKLDTIVEENEEEILDLDNMEINIEKEQMNSTNFLLQKRIKELEIVVENILEEKAKLEKLNSTLKTTIEQLSCKGIVIPKHLSSVHPSHISQLKGFKMIYKTLGNGRCLENSVAVHIFEDEDEGENVKKLVNNFIADNWDNYFHHKIALPYTETIGVGSNAKCVRKESKEEMLAFLRSEESLWHIQTHKSFLLWLPCSILTSISSPIMERKDFGHLFVQSLHWLPLRS